MVLPSSRRYGTVALVKRVDGEPDVFEIHALYAPPSCFASAAIWQNVSTAAMPPSFPFSVGDARLTKTRLHVLGAKPTSLSSPGTSGPAPTSASVFDTPSSPPLPLAEPPAPALPAAPPLPPDPPPPAAAIDPAAPVEPPTPDASALPDESLA